MALIIFDKQQRVSFQRFSLSVFSGVSVLLVLGVIHSLLHSASKFSQMGLSFDSRLLLLASAIGIILGVIYFANDGPAAWNERTMVETRKQLPIATPGYMRSENIRKLFAYMIGGDILIFGFGLHWLVWQPILSGQDMVSAIGNMAISSIAIFLPMHYVALLKLDMFTTGVSEEVCEFAQHRFGQILYWVLVVFWAILFASYLILLLYSKPYCRFIAC